MNDNLSNKLCCCHSWRFTLSETKTVTKIFTWRRIPQGLHIILDGTSMELVTSWCVFSSKVDLDIAHSLALEFVQDGHVVF